MRVSEHSERLCGRAGVEVSVLLQDWARPRVPRAHAWLLTGYAGVQTAANARNTRSVQSTRAYPASKPPLEPVPRRACRQPRRAAPSGYPCARSAPSEEAGVTQLVTNFETLPPTLAARLNHAVYLAERWGVVSMTVTLDTSRGFDAELVYPDAPAWRSNAHEFNTLEDGVMQQLIEYVYEHRLKPDPDAGLHVAIERMTAEDFQELRRETEQSGHTDTLRDVERLSRPELHSVINSLTTWLALGVCASGTVGFALATVLAARVTSLAGLLAFATLATVFLALTAGIIIALAGVRSPVWRLLARWAARRVPLDADFGPFKPRDVSRPPGDTGLNE
jgi:hypothetical protein